MPCVTPSRLLTALTSDTDSDSRIRLITPLGVVTTIAGSAAGTAVDAVGSNARFNAPIGVAFAPWSSTIIVSDVTNSRIRLISYPGAVVTTLAGGGGAASLFADGTGTAATLSGQYGVAVIPATGSVVVADRNNHIRIITMPLAGNLAACDSKWHHVALAYSPSASPYQLQSFLDGALVAQLSVSATLPASASSTLRVGWSGDLNSNAGSLFSGSLAEMRVYSRALSAAEVVALSQPPLAAYLAAFPNSAASPALATAGTTSYVFTCTTPGSFGVASLVRAAADFSWAWAGGVAPSCTPCPAGAYSAGAASCTACPLGIATTGPGSTSVTACTVCAPGFSGAVTSPGTASAAGCAICAAGSTSAAGAASCTLCPASLYSYGAANTCASCAAGASFLSSASGCAPSSTLAAGPSDTTFYLSGSSAEGVAAFSTISAPAGATFVTGVFGAASGALALSSGSSLALPGSNAPSALPAAGATAFSASAWVKCAAPAKYSSVLEWGSAGDAQGIVTPSALALVVAGGASVPGAGVVALNACDGRWHHVAISYAAAVSPFTSLTAYIDGTVASQQSVTISLPAAASALLRVGTSGGAGSNATAFAGSLAELRIYSRALTVAEVVALSQPPLAAVANTVASPALPTAGTTAYSIGCTAGYSGQASALAQSLIDNSWAWAGGVVPSCTICAPGTFAAANSASCTACPGAGSSYAGARTPQECFCSSGSFSNGLVYPNLICTPCGPGSNSSQASTFCTCAAPATWLPGSNTCYTQPSATPSPSSSPSMTRTPSSSPTVSQSSTPSLSPSPTPTTTASLSASPSRTASPSGEFFLSQDGALQARSSFNPQITPLFNPRNPLPRDADCDSNG